MKPLKTIENLHNFNFESNSFPATPTWKNKTILMRQIAFDSNMLETWFVLDKKSFDLYLYFEPFGTKKDPRILKIGKMPKNYLIAIEYLAILEIKVLWLINSEPYQNLEKITTPQKLKSLFSLYYK